MIREIAREVRRVNLKMNLGHRRVKTFLGRKKGKLVFIFNTADQFFFNTPTIIKLFNAHFTRSSLLIPTN